LNTFIFVFLISTIIFFIPTKLYFEYYLSNYKNYSKGGISMREQGKIMKVRKNSQGDITDVMLNDGNVYSITDAIELAKDHKIEGVNVGKAKNGREYLRSNPNGQESDNLDHLKTF
jgi:hypothetical protein